MFIQAKHSMEVEIEKKIWEYCEEKSIEPLFGAVVSNRSRHTENCFSDYDFFLVCEFPQLKQEVILEQDIVQNTDFLVFDINFLLNLSQYEQEVHCTDRPKDYYSEVLFEILCSEFIWDNNYIKSNKEGLCKAIVFKDVYNYFHVRAKGNFKQIQKNGEWVSLRKCLLTVHGLFIMKWLNENKTLAIFDINILCQKYLKNHQKLKEYIDVLLFINKVPAICFSDEGSKEESILGIKIKMIESMKKKNIMIKIESRLIDYIDTELKNLKLQEENVCKLSINKWSSLYDY